MIIHKQKNQAGAAPLIIIAGIMLCLLAVIAIIAAVCSSGISTMAVGGPGDGTLANSGDPTFDYTLNPLMLPTGGCLIYYWKVEPQFAQQVRNGGTQIGMDPNWMMAIMEFESGLSPSRTNPSTFATGLIQFMPDTASRMGTSVGALRGMSRMQQWSYAERYFRDGVRAFGRPRSLSDAYMIVLNPSNVRTGEGDVMRTVRGIKTYFWTGTPGTSRGTCSSGNAYYCQNAGLDFAPRNGAITKFEAGSVVRQRYQQGYAGCVGRK